MPVARPGSSVLAGRLSIFSSSGSSSRPAQEAQTQGLYAAAGAVPLLYLRLLTLQGLGCALAIDLRSDAMLAFAQAMPQQPRTPARGAHSGAQCAMDTPQDASRKGHCDIATPYCDMTMVHCDIAKRHCDIATPRCDMTMRHCDIATPHCDMTMGHCAIATRHCDMKMRHCDIATAHCDIATPRCDMTMRHCDIAKPHCDMTMRHCDMKKWRRDVARTDQTQASGKGRGVLLRS